MALASQESGSPDYPKMDGLQWKIHENMDDLGVPRLTLETSILISLADLC
jgi:hypothetical protein